MRFTPAQPPLLPLSDGVVALRMRRASDFDAIVANHQDPAVLHWLTDRPVPGDSPALSVRRATEQWASGRGAPFVIADNESDRPLGLINLRFENDDALVAYNVFPEARGRGTAPRALLLVSSWAFSSLGLSRLTLEADRRNTASIRVAEKSGFRWVRDRSERGADGEELVMAIYLLTAGDTDTHPQ
jgi:RimJ/RimL family protein N-acetyltransferase